MIVQGIINWWAEVVSALLMFIPPLPTSWQQALTAISEGGASLARQVAMFGPIAPFDQMSIMLGIWASVLGFWFTTLGVRVVLKAVGR